MQHQPNTSNRPEKYYATKNHKLQCPKAMTPKPGTARICGHVTTSRIPILAFSLIGSYRLPNTKVYPVQQTHQFLTRYLSHIHCPPPVHARTTAWRARILGLCEDTSPAQPAATSLGLVGDLRGSLRRPLYASPPTIRTTISW